MSYPAIFLIIVGLGILVALVLRFVQPELIYSLRQALILIRMNKLFLDDPAKRTEAGRAYLQLILTEKRFETRAYDPEYVQYRVQQMRALSRALDPRWAPENAADYPAERICVMELADILKNQARRLVPRQEYFGASVDASALLRFIANRKRKVLGWPPLANQKEVEQWFLSHPISMEQTVELLATVVFVLACRQEVETDAQSARKKEDLQEEITALEVHLRALVCKKYKSLVMKKENVSSQKITEKVYQEFMRALGEEQYNQIKLRQKQSRGEGIVAIEFADFLYVKELQKLINAEWELFAKVFGDPKWLDNRLGMLIKVRAETKDSQEISNGDKQLALTFCKEIQEKLGEQEGPDVVSLVHAQRVGA